MFDNSDFPMDLPPAKTLEGPIRKLRNSVARGKLELRRELVQQLGMYAFAQMSQGDFEDATDTVKEILEYNQTFSEEKQSEACFEIAQVLTTLLTIGRAKRTHLDSTFDFRPLCQLIAAAIVRLPKNDFDSVKNEWFLDLVADVCDWHEFSGMDVAAIARLDELQRLIETHLNTNTTMFTEWNPLLRLLKIRGELKHEIGDRLGAIEDLLKYQEIAEKAVAIAHKRADKLAKVDGDPADGKIVIRVNAEEYVQFLAFTPFPAEWFAATLNLADYYTEHADKVNSLIY